jgi:large repetitive protein
LSSTVNNGAGTVGIGGMATGPAGTIAAFTVSVTDSSNPPQTTKQMLSIKVDNPPAPSFTSAAQLPGAMNGVAYSQAIGVSGGLPPYTIAPIAGSLPNGLKGAFAKNQFAISGTPNDVAQNYSITLQLTDSSNPQQQVTQKFTLALSPAPPLALGPSSLPDATEGSNYSQTVTASGGLPPYAFSPVSNLPAGLTSSVNGAMLTISGVPTGPAGPSNFTVQVSDSSSPKQTATQTFTPNVKLPPAPTLAPASLPDGTLGSPYSQ